MLSTLISPKAFDSVSHPKLLYKLSAYGLIGRLLEIMTAFLSNRLQRVAIDNACSPYAPVTTWLASAQSSRRVAVFTVYYLRESSRERLCNHRRWFVSLSVCLSVCLFVCLFVCYHDN